MKESCHPQALGPRLLLSRVLLREGQDFATAEKALREVLALEPRHAEARHNLDLLLQDKAKVGPADVVFLGNVPGCQARPPSSASKSMSGPIATRAS